MDVWCRFLLVLVGIARWHEFISKSDGLMIMLFGLNCKANCQFETWNFIAVYIVIKKAKE